MLALFGFHKKDIREIYEILTLNNVEKWTIALLNSTESKYLQSKIYLILGVAELLQNIARLEKEKCIVVVFDCLEQLENIKNLRILDKENSNLKYYASTIFSVGKKSLFVVNYKAKNEIIKILNGKNVGFIHTYNTLYYKISNKVLQEKVKALVIGRLSSKIAEKTFTKKLTDILPIRGKGREVVTTILNLVNGEEGDKLREAITEAIRTKADTNTDTNLIASKFKVEGFDIRYFLAVSKVKNNEKQSKSKSRSRSK